MPIERVHQETLPFSSVPFVPLLNQKNYYTEYLRKDDQFRMVRNTRETVVVNLKRRKLAKAGGGGGGGGGANSATATAEPDDDDDNDNDNDPSERVLVLHPGADTLKLGWSTDIEAVSVPNLIAHRSATPHMLPSDPKRHIVERKVSTLDTVDSPTFAERKAPIRESFKDRMKYYKRRMLPNSTEQCLLFNRKGQSEVVEEGYEIDTVLSKDARTLVGDQVLTIGDLENWTVRSPFASGSLSTFNDSDTNYTSAEEIYGDIELMLRHAFKTHFDVSAKDHQSINVMLVLPNAYSKAYVETMMEILLVRMNFKNVAFIQEALASSFGAGLSSSCIVDIGARGIHIACVEDGVVSEHSRVELDYGINDVIRMWGKSLINQQMQWRPNLSDVRDFFTLRQSLRDCATFDDEAVGINTTSILVKHREQGGLKVERFILKVWDDVMTCPMGLFYPDVFDEPEEESVLMGTPQGMPLAQLTPVRAIHTTPVLASKAGVFEGYVNESSLSPLQKLQECGASLTGVDPKLVLETLSEMYHDAEPNVPAGAKKGRPSRLASEEWIRGKFDLGLDEDEDATKPGVSSFLRRNMTPLDAAIAQSIAAAGCEDPDKMENFWANVCVVGGGGCIKGVEGMLMDRLHMVRSNVLCNTKLHECIGKIKDWRKSKPADEFVLTDDQLGKLEKILGGGAEAPIDVMGPSDLNPATVGWKGGCVYAKLRVIEEMWVSQEDWELLGGRSIRYGGLFVT